MIVVVVIIAVVFLALFGFMYWLADKIDREQEQLNQYNEWLRQREQYAEGWYGYGSWI